MGKKKVLYAEDEYTNRKLIEIRLRDAGVDCDLASDGKEALSLFRNGSYDMIILDHYMPEINGDKVAEEIRKSDPKIPIIAITSNDEENEHLRHAGFNEVIVKPLRGYAAIRRILNYLREEE